MIMCSSNVPYTRQDVLNAEFVFGVATFSSGLFLPKMISFNLQLRSLLKEPNQAEEYMAALVELQAQMDATHLNFGGLCCLEGLYL